MSFSEQGMPTHLELVPFVLRAADELGGSGKSQEIVEKVNEIHPHSEELAAVEYPSRPGSSVFNERISWARSTAKLSGALQQPSRGMYLLTDKGIELLSRPDTEIVSFMTDFQREYNFQKRQQKKIEELQESAEINPDQASQDLPESDEPSQEVLHDAAEENDATYDWRQQLLARLHRLPPEGFEKFVIYLLKRYGLKLAHMGGTGDEGIDAIGTAPISPVLSSRVAVQVKRYDPNGKPIGRETVALFQRDALTKGAERAILVTLSRFTEPARRAAVAAMPTVDLIDGNRLCDLVRDDGESGVRFEPTVNEVWFDQFE